MTLRQAALIVGFGYLILCVQSRGCITAQEVRQAFPRPSGIWKNDTLAEKL